MIFLVDAQLPKLLCDILLEIGVESKHVDSLPAGDETSDQEIISYADKYDMVIITKDSDFLHSHLLYRKPVKLLLVTTGNTKNRQLFDLFRQNIGIIKATFERGNFLELSNRGFITHD